MINLREQILGIVNMCIAMFEILYKLFEINIIFIMGYVVIQILYDPIQMQQNESAWKCIIAQILSNELNK